MDQLRFTHLLKSMVCAQELTCVLIVTIKMLEICILNMLKLTVVQLFQVNQQVEQILLQKKTLCFNHQMDVKLHQEELSQHVP
jgi:hypothetical protein